jgi:hypothetical protein
MISHTMDCRSEAVATRHRDFRAPEGAFWPVAIVRTAREPPFTMRENQAPHGLMLNRGQTREGISSILASRHGSLSSAIATDLWQRAPDGGKMLSGAGGRLRQPASRAKNATRGSSNPENTYAGQTTRNGVAVCDRSFDLHASRTARRRCSRNRIEAQRASGRAQPVTDPGAGASNHEKCAHATEQARAVIAIERDLLGLDKPELINSWNLIGESAEAAEDWGITHGQLQSRIIRR